jgi:5-methylcytosine-specific restriction enzyme subunit McrC
MNIPIQNIYIMLIYSWQKHNEKEIVNVDLEGQTNLQNLFAKVLINGINHLFKRGVNRDYRSVEEPIRSVKGKINFNTTLKKNLLRSGRVQCEFDEFDENNIQNQILKATISSLVKMQDIDKEYKAKLVHQRKRFNDVSNIHLAKNHFNSLRFNSNNRFYEFLLNVCEMIYSSLLPSQEKGKYKFRKFSEDKLDVLFESFVRNFYNIEQEKLKVKSEKFDWAFDTLTEGSGAFLPEMRTDISLFNDDRKIIIDTKFYKEALKTNQWGKKIINQNHLYQLTAYMNNTSLSEDQSLEGILLYPTTDDNFDHQFKRRDGRKVSAKSIDLNQSFENIKNDLLAIIY